MAKKKLIAEITAHPARFYRMPADVMRDRRFSDEERMEILDAWERDVRDKPEEEGIKQVMETRLELQKKRAAQIDRDPAKPGGDDEE